MVALGMEGGGQGIAGKTEGFILQAVGATDSTGAATSSRFSCLSVLRVETDVFWESPRAACVLGISEERLPGAQTLEHRL